MSFKLLFTLVVLIISSEALQGPCNYKNVTIMSGVSFKPIVTPAACGTATVNASELSTKPNVILNSVDEAHERNESYTFMLLEEIPNVRDLFKLRWLVSNVTPLRKSLTANETSIPFAKYSKPTADPVRKLKLFLYVYKQNKTAGTGLVGLAQADFEHFAPQKWVTQNERLIQGIVGGAEFYVNPNASHAGHTNTHGGPVLPPMGTPGQHYPGQPQPGYPSQQPGYPSQQPGYPSQQPAHPGQQPGYPSQQPAHPGQQPGYPSQQPAHPGQQPYPQPGTNQPTVINNNHYYGKVKDDKKKKNSAVSSLPFASLVAVMASVAILRP